MSSFMQKCRQQQRAGALRFQRARREAVDIVTRVEQRRQRKAEIAEQFALRQRAAGEPTTLEIALALAQPLTTASKEE